jgi:hypothetical protein
VLQAAARDAHEQAEQLRLRAARTVQRAEDLLAEIALDLTGFKYRGHVIYATARALPSGDWAPRLLVSWVEDGSRRVDEIPLHLTAGFASRQEAEIAALRLGRAWVDGREVGRSAATD